MLQPGEHCRAINRETYPVQIGWGNVFYLLPPNEARIVPTDAIFSFFGDPRATTEMKSQELPSGEHGWIPDRPTELRRLRAKWAKENQDTPEDTLTTAHVDVYDLTDESLVPTVAADPLGVTVNPSIQTIQSMDERDAIIARMQAQLDSLLKERNLESEVIPVTVENQIPVDEPADSTPEPKIVRAKAVGDDE